MNSYSSIVTQLRGRLSFCGARSAICCGCIYGSLAKVWINLFKLLPTVYFHSSRPPLPLLCTRLISHYFFAHTITHSALISGQRVPFINSRRVHIYKPSDVIGTKREIRTSRPGEWPKTNIFVIHFLMPNLYPNFSKISIIV